MWGVIFLCGGSYAPTPPVGVEDPVLLGMPQEGGQAKTSLCLKRLGDSPCYAGCCLSLCVTQQNGVFDPLLGAWGNGVSSPTSTITKQQALPLQNTPLALPPRPYLINKGSLSPLGG